MSVIALVAWDQAPRWGKRQKTGSNTQITSRLASLADFPPPFLPNAEPVPRLSFGAGGNIFKTEISLKEWTKGFEGWAAGKSGKSDINSSSWV